MQILRRLVPMLLAATTLAPVAALAAAPSPMQTFQEEEEESDLTPAQAVTTWNCYTVVDNVHRGQVKIWWGHTADDAKWACDQWISTCGNSQGGCYATRVQ